MVIIEDNKRTNMTPALCGIIDGVYYNDGMIAFKTVDTFTKGNAVIAAKDASGKILWSWHIWLTDNPAEHTYNNSAGTMMDRNLGATSATPGNVGAYGLLYQWGRKDPFLDSSSTTESIVAASTITWPEVVETNSSINNDYVTANPTTFVTSKNSSVDWYYNNSEDLKATDRWGKNKTIYDPCPPGWRVPTQQHIDGVWTGASGKDIRNYSASNFKITYVFDDGKRGMNFCNEFGTASTIWYPAQGYRSSSTGVLTDVGNCGHYWSYCFIISSSSLYPPSWTQYWGTYVDKGSFTLSIYSDDAYRPNHGQYLATGNAVRCVKVTN